MQFSEILGHTVIVDNLRKMVDSGRIPHAVLFTERPGCGALTLALAAIQYLFCTDRKEGDSCGRCHPCNKVEKLIHPDLHFTFPTNTSVLTGKDKKSEIDDFYPLWRQAVLSDPYFSEQQLYKTLGIENKFGIISVSEASSIIRKLSLSSYEGGPKVMLIMFPERMNTEAANKLLKSLEEPQPDTYYFMISHNPGKILATILSRCRIIETGPIEESRLADALSARFGLQKEDAAFWARCSGGSYGKAVEMIEEGNENNDKYITFVTILESAVKKDLVSLFEIWEKVAGWGKEDQKSLCIEALEILRKTYMLGLGLDDISYTPRGEREKLKELSGKIRKDFYMKGYGFLNSAIEHIERNVNPKFIFCDLCNRIYYNV